MSSFFVIVTGEKEYTRRSFNPQTDADSFVSSEAAKDFMARLRIGIMADQAPAPDPKTDQWQT